MRFGLLASLTGSIIVGKASDAFALLIQRVAPLAGSASHIKRWTRYRLKSPASEVSLLSRPVGTTGHTREVVLKLFWKTRCKHMFVIARSSCGH